MNCLVNFFRGNQGSQSRRDQTQNSKNSSCVVIHTSPQASFSLERKEIPRGIMGIVISFLDFQEQLAMRSAHRSLSGVSSLMVSFSTYEDLHFVQDNLHRLLHLQDKNLSFLCKFPLVKLHISYLGSSITDAGLAKLRALSSLREISLNCADITSRGLEQLNNLSSLQSFSGDYITDTGLNILSNISSLKELRFQEGERITDVGLGYLSKLSSLESLHLRLCAITNAGLSSLNASINLKQLFIIQCDNISDVSHLSNLTPLQTLFFYSCKNIADFGVTKLSSITSLHELCISSCVKFTDACAATLSHIKSLRLLDLSFSLLTDASIPSFKGLTALQGLDLSYCKFITDVGMSILSVTLSSIQSLSLEGCPLSDNGVSYLGRLNSLKKLSLGSPHITDMGIRSLNNLTSLQYLKLGEQCKKIHQIAVTRFGHFRFLRKLDLQCPINQYKWLGEEWLKEFPSLKILTLSDWRCANANINTSELQRSLNIQIIRSK